MKTVCIGDLHGKNIWKQIVEKENDADTFVFLGDYFDSFDVPPVEQLYNFEEIVRFKRESGKEVVMLIGNHDFHYFPGFGSITRCSGYQPMMFNSFSHSIDTNRDCLQVCYAKDGFLFSHAGVSVRWLKTVFKKDWTVDNVVEKVNDMFLSEFRWFNFKGLDPYGDDVQQSPIWIRPRSLKIANNNTNLYRKYIQVVGHTHTKEITYSGRNYFVDTFDTCNEYLTIVDGKVILASL